MTLEEPEKLPTSQGTDTTIVNNTLHIQPSEAGRVEESKVKRFKNAWKKWEEGQDSDWWFASTGIP